MTERSYVRWSLARLAHEWLETFELRYGPWPVPPGQTVIGEWPLEVTPRTSSVEVLARVLPAHWTDEDAAAYFDGNLEVERADHVVTSAGIPAMLDDVFWATFSGIRGTAPQGLEEIAQRLTMLDDSDVIGFSLRFHTVMASLRNAVGPLLNGATGSPGSVDLLDATCAAIIAAGRSAHDAVMKSPDLAFERYVGEGLPWEPLLVVAEQELAHRRGVGRVVITRSQPTSVAPPEHGRSVLRPWAQVKAEQESALEVSWLFAPRHDSELKPWYSVESLTDWVSTRFIVRSSGILVERIMTWSAAVDPPTSDGLVEVGPRRAANARRSAVERITDGLGSGDTIVCLETLVANPAPWNGGLFSIRRASTVGEDEYRDKYLIASDGVVAKAT